MHAPSSHHRYPDPYMADVTPLNDGAVPPRTYDGKFVTTMNQKHPDNDDETTLESAFAWIPTVFQVSEDGQHVEIQDYINGLGPRERFPVLYRLVEQTFRIAMPMLEKTVGHTFENVVANGSCKSHGTTHPLLPMYGTGPDVELQLVRRWEERRTRRNDIGEEELAARQAREKANEEAARQAAEAKRLKEKMQERAAFFDSANQYIPEANVTTESKWAGKQVKVIVKAANYILQPGQEYSGTWHLEGMPHERIVASAIYYYERDPSIIDAGLYLRRKRDGNEDFPNQEDSNRDVSIQDHQSFPDSLSGLGLEADVAFRSSGGRSLIQTRHTDTDK
jgi:hypothetical protein